MSDFVHRWTGTVEDFNREIAPNPGAAAARAQAEVVARSRWWQPQPVLEKHGRLLVLREDLVPGGSKIRFLPFLIGGAKEVVFGGPFCGGAPFALSEWGKREGVKVTLFYAKRKELHPRQRAALQNGAQLYQVPFGYMSHVQAKAKQYAQDHGALFLPLGFDKEEAVAPFLDQIRRAAAAAGPLDEVWCATGSGMLARCLGLGFPEAKVYGVTVGLESRHSAQQFPANVELVPSGYKFEQACREKAPFSSCPNYDRKAWAIASSRARGRALFWNVMGEHS